MMSFVSQSIHTAQLHKVHISTEKAAGCPCCVFPGGLGARMAYPSEQNCSSLSNYTHTAGPSHRETADRQPGRQAGRQVDR
mmetsp:Transcript_43573/g.123481  ORF Transcript_43573/g.123481 Transcript_43573/m.123481 type:complete len:81 (-) Transcript_43573:74-316(-)